MKKLKEYEVNDGLDGVILAKGLKQAVKILAPYYAGGYGYTEAEILNDIKKSEKDPYNCDYTFSLTSVHHVAKKGKNRKPRMIGWCES